MKRSKIQNRKSKIAVIGGGPGGLYSSLLLKKANPALDITLFERNPHGATYGWGVVFSDRTLSAFREADYKSYQAITGQFVIWDAIDVFYHGERIRCGGHVFAGLARRNLLLLLQERCRELGVKLKFKTEVTDLSEFAGYDLIIAADGVNSFVRKTYADIFKPDLAVGKAKYIWFGTHRVFDSFTFIFRENEHGLFQVHAYPFNGDTSTFIIECEEATWRRAGLDKANEAESIAYCEKLFAGDLAGRALMSNRSQWINFIRVKNKVWHHRNIVLIGDAVHTAHFSIGSGTKLAMEDAIALANAFEAHDDIEVALNYYALERRPRVELLQEAALESRTYFENVKRYHHLDPLQFTFHLLTRSGRISYNNLRLRDPYFSESVDRRFAETNVLSQQDVTSTGSQSKTQNRPRPALAKPKTIIAAPPMFAPLKLRQLILPNRVVLSPTSSDSAEAGKPNQTHLRQLSRRAMGGVGMVMTEPVAVSAAGRITSGSAGMYCPEHQAAWAEIVEAVRATGAAKIALQLNHAGRRGSTRPRWTGLDRPLLRGNWPLLSASPLPYLPQNQTPQEMDRAAMDAVREAFVAAARMAHRAGFDMLQLHFAHGYLLASFLSPLTNVRRDDYGGSLENRMRFLLEVFAAVREAWPATKPISVAISATDWAKGGFVVDEAVIVAQQLKDQGCDLLEILAGQTTAAARPVYGPYFLAPFSEQIRHQAGIATMISGDITITDQINSILAAGRADLCIMDPPRWRA